MPPPKSLPDTYEPPLLPWQLDCTKTRCASSRPPSSSSSPSSCSSFSLWIAQPKKSGEQTEGAGLLACLLPSLLMYETGLPHWGCLDHSFAHLVNVSMWNTWVKIVALRPILAYWVGVEHMISLLLLPSLEEGPKTYPPTLGEIEIELDKYPCVCSPRFAPKGQEVLLLLVVIIIIILVSSSTSSSSSVG